MSNVIDKINKLISMVDKEISIIESTNKLIGGESDNKTISDIATIHGVTITSLDKQIELGMDVEREHTSDSEIAREIVFDHLTEDPEYYTKLATLGL